MRGICSVSQFIELLTEETVQGFAPLPCTVPLRVRYVDGSDHYSLTPPRLGKSMLDGECGGPNHCWNKLGMWVRRWPGGGEGHKFSHHDSRKVSWYDETRVINWWYSDSNELPVRHGIIFTSQNPRQLMFNGYCSNNSVWWDWKWTLMLVFHG